MNRIAGFCLAATFLVPVAAAAQTVAPPVKWEDVPATGLKTPGTAAAPVFRPAPPPAAPGVSWQQASPPPAARPVAPVAPQANVRPAPAPRATVAPQIAPRAVPAPQAAPMARADARHGPAPMAHAPGVGQRHHGVAGADHRATRSMVHRNGDRRARRHLGMNGYSNYSRIERGFALPQYWWGPAFTIGNWNQYGLSQPMHGGRWVRYYDDALLVDGYGRVQDGRWDMSWDQYGDEWGYDDRGIPVYVGDGDFYPEEEDYAWAEQHEGYAGGYGYEQQGYQGYGHAGYGQGYAYPAHGYGYGAVVTETTVTTSPTVITETHYVDEVVHKAPRRGNRVKAHRSKLIRCNC